VSCETFDRWLDGGRPAPLAESMLAHARDCERCRRALSASRALEDALGAEPAAAPAPRADFTAAVMARIEPRPAAAVARLQLPPLWLRLARDPALVGGALVAALALSQRAALTRGLEALSTRAGATWAPLSAGGAAVARRFVIETPAWNLPGGEWIAMSLLLCTVLPLSWWLYRSSQHWLVRQPRPR
jgi:hypothetical protein